MPPASPCHEMPIGDQSICSMLNMPTKMPSSSDKKSRSAMEKERLYKAGGLEAKQVLGAGKRKRVVMQVM